MTMSGVAIVLQDCFEVITVFFTRDFTTSQNMELRHVSINLLDRGDISASNHQSPHVQPDIEQN